MPITQLNQLQIAYKKLLGKSHVSPNRTEVTELIPSFVQSANSTVFGQTLPSGSQIPTNQTASLYQTSSGGIVELVRFELTQLGDGDYTPSNGSLSGTSIDEQAENTTNGAHGYALRISGSYNARSNNPRKNTGLFTDGGSLTGSAGSLQLVPLAYDSRYAAKVYQSNGTEIAGSNAIEWSLDYASGVLFVQDYDVSVIPTFVDAFLYIGKYTNEVLADLNASLQSAAGTNAYAIVSVGGVAVIADNSTGNLTIASGSFGGAATSNNNLLVSASAGNDTITFSLVDSPRFTHITASGNISASGNLSVTGTSTLTGDSTIGGNLTVNGNTTLGNAAADTASITAGRVNISNLTAGSSELAVLVTGSGGQVFTRQLAASAFSGGNGVSGSGTANRLVLWSGTNSVNDDAELSFDRASNLLTIGSSTFGNDTTINNNLTVTGDLTVNGETTIINTTNLSIEDKFIVLGRGVGSTAPASEGGIIVEGAGGSGSAFVFNSGSGANVSNRWGIATNVPTGSTNVTPTDFMVSVSQSSAAPSTAPSYGGSAGGFGNMYIQDNGEIWIYS